ncbi:hypothetical protein J8281_02045 [Aquimarina sp. U1-2]|uniref:hypothetical protein n=1 Tax=Aquimarina sp. U1-2 TaxID=2823141 RepID=UPI001AECF01F|nr:hypothetical protein [Aquimarina sp. U1-2]MBP2830955.1 hypothetical protein [Aquimarina sp. U1-2]
MKTLIKSIFIASIIITTHSCSDDDEAIGATGSTAGATIRIEDSEITALDANSDLTLNLSGNNQITSISIVKEGQEFEDGDTFSEDENIGTATISGDVATFSASTLLPFVFPGKEEGDTKSTGSFDLDITYEGGEISPAFVRQTVTVRNVTQVSQEVKSVIVKDTATSAIKFGASTGVAPIDSFVVTVRDQNGTQLADISDQFEISNNRVNDSIVIERETYITEYNKSKGDTLIYSFTATSGTLSQTTETKVAIVPQPLGEIVEGVFAKDTTRNQLNLLTGETSIKDAFSGDIEFVGPQGFEAISNTNDDGQTYTTDIEFVELSINGAKAFEAYNDVEQAKEDFDAGTAVSSVQVQNGDIYVYKITRNVGTAEEPVDKVFYGAILVNEVTITNPSAADPGVEFDILVRESSIIPMS